MDDKVGVKLVVVGDGAVGKTTLLMRYRENKFPTKYIPTVFENYYKHVMYRGVNVNLGLWDTAGQEEYDRLRSLSYHDTDIVLVVFAIDQPTSLENLSSKWVPEVSYQCKDTPIIVVGTKADLRNDQATSESLAQQGQRTVTEEDGRAKAREIGAEAYMECSALTGDGVQAIFDRALDTVLHNKKVLKSKKGCLIL